MSYYCLTDDGVTRKFGLSIEDLRYRIFGWLLTHKNNMECAVLIYESKNDRIVEKDYLTWVGKKAFYCIQKSTGPETKTFRSYYPIEEYAIRWILGHGLDFEWIEILTMKGKQIQMTGGLIE